MYVIQRLSQYVLMYVQYVCPNVRQVQYVLMYVIQRLSQYALMYVIQRLSLDQYVLIYVTSFKG